MTGAVSHIYNPSHLFFLQALQEPVPPCNRPVSLHPQYGQPGANESLRQPQPQQQQTL